MGVNRCACEDISFEELKRIAQERGCTFDELKSMTGCASDCGLCEPYIRLMLKTGNTNIEPMHPATIEKLLLERAK